MEKFFHDKIKAYRHILVEHYQVYRFDERLLRGLVKYLGDRIRDRDDTLVACSDPQERQAVKEELLIGELGLTDSPELDQFITRICQEMSEHHPRKERAIFYYLLVQKVHKAAHFYSEGMEKHLPDPLASSCR